MTATGVHGAPIIHEHHERLARNVDRIPATADLIGQADAAEMSAALEQTCTFLSDLLVPHMAAAERAVYPELERLFQNKHAMTPMRREHAQIRASIRDVDEIRVKAIAGPLTMTQQMRLRRALFGVYALLKIHLAEELLYADIIEAGATPEKEEALAAAMAHAGTASF